MIAPIVPIDARMPAVNYEFINSLASVRSVSELLVDFPGMDAQERNQFLSVIHTETGRLMQLMGQLKPLSDMSG